MRGQSTFLDFGTGFLLFAIVLVIAGSYLTTRTSIPEAPDGLRISNELLTSGAPEHWNETSVTIPGILTDDVVNETKWNILAAKSPDELRELLFLTGDTYIRLVRYTPTGYEEILSPIRSEPVAYSAIPDIGARAVSTTPRITTYAGEIVVLEVIVWR